MASLKDTSKATEGAIRLLTQTYTQLSAEDAAAILKPLAQQQADDVLQALDAHIVDTREVQNQIVGRWPPKAADLMGHIQRIARNQPGVGQTIDRPGQKYVVRSVPPEAAAFVGARKVEVLTAECDFCGDSGMARFYYDLKDLRRVWLPDEALDLPDAILSRAKCVEAICDCKIGTTDPRRGWKCRRYPSEKKLIHTYPRMETIRKLAALRLERELSVTT